MPNARTPAPPRSARKPSPPAEAPAPAPAAPAVPVNDILVGDTIATLNALPAGFADLVFADPPYNIGFKYDQYHDAREDDDYVSFTHQWVDAAIRATRPTGSLFLMIGDEYAAEMRMHLKSHEKKGSVFFRNWIIWHYTFGQNCKAKFNRSHVSIFYVTRDEKNFTFHGDKIRIPSARQTTYADTRANPKGKLPDDTWVLRPQEEEAAFKPDDDTWYNSRLCGTFKERVDWHPCQIPQKLLHRIITVASNPGDLVLDPFSGSGTTALAAKSLGRNYLGVELSPDYAAKTKARLAQVQAATE
jgi:site-specific DNA-methyltransferase (adenine-specific)